MNRPAVPRTVRVGPLTWRIKTSTADFNKQAVASNDSDASGFCDLPSLTITVNGDAPLSLQRETLLHELLHAIIQTQGGVFDNVKKSRLEEATVSAITPLLLTALRANEDVLEFILGD